MLKSFKVNNGYMTSEFSPEVFSYEINLDDNEPFLDFTYTAEGKVTIYGNQNLTYGLNHILIEVYDNNEVVTYTFIVNKEKVFQTLGEVLPSYEGNIKENFLSDIRIPCISSVTFLIIVILFCIIFKRK